MHSFDTYQDMHILSITVYLIYFGIKVLLLLFNQEKALEIVKERARVLEILLPTLFVGTGIYMINGGSPMFTANPTWFYIKLAMIIGAIVTGVIAFKQMNKWLAVASMTLFIATYLHSKDLFF